MSAAPTPSLFLGIDFGTSGCRAVLIDANGEQQAHSTVTLPSPLRRANAVEQQPQLWLDALATVLDQLGPARLTRVAAIAIDGTSATTLLCDAAGQPSGPALMYNDSRASAAAERIAALAPPDSAARGPASSLAKLLWLADALPPSKQSGDRPALALHQADWVLGWLRGEYGDSDENNALKAGYDPVNRCWPSWVLRLIGERVQLPRVHPPGTALGSLDHDVARRFGFDPDTEVISGTTDSTAAFIATGASQVGDAVTTLGSTLVLKVLSATPVASAAHGIYSHRLGELWLVGGASNSGGAVLRQYFSDAQMQAWSTALDFNPPLGLDYYPLVANGERFPLADPTLAPRLQPRPAADADFFQAILEGIAAIEQQGYAALQRHGAPWPTRVFSSGGGAANRRWGAYRKQLLDTPESAAPHTEAAYGAALLALRGSTTASRQP